MSYGGKKVSARRTLFSLFLERRSPGRRRRRVPTTAAAVEVLREMRKLDREWIGWSYLSIARDISIAPFCLPPSARYPSITSTEPRAILPYNRLFLSSATAILSPIRRSSCSRCRLHIRDRCEMHPFLLYNNFRRRDILESIARSREIIKGTLDFSSCARWNVALAIMGRVIF